jgi:hydroxylamine dehydrogenase
MEEHTLTELLISNNSRIVLLVVDGLGGLPVEPGGPTELEIARTPNPDRLAAEAECGLHQPVRTGITPGSGPAHLALFGYDPVACQVGRGGLSALGVGFDLRPGDVAARGNFCTLDEEGLVADRRAGRLATEMNRKLTAFVTWRRWELTLRATLTMLFSAGWLAAMSSAAPAAEISSGSQACLGCHRIVSPGLVADWEGSRHSRTAPKEAWSAKPLERRISTRDFPDETANSVVGCAECHTLNPADHEDTFDHNGFQVHPVVTPNDCSTCHGVERSQYRDNLMSKAHSNLADNALFHDLQKTAIATPRFEAGKILLQDANRETEGDACYFCHGTRVQRQGSEVRKTRFGDMSFPVLIGWPNVGVGRINPDGSEGACTSCHARHSFAIEMARKPVTCSECHKGPDVPAYKVYGVSKHGNIYESFKEDWNWDAVPWRVGRDFTAPTCAECHASLVVSPQGEVLAERTHRFNDRLAWRLFGLIYAHPHPLSADTTGIRNQAGLPLPVGLKNEVAEQYVISGKEQSIRRERMQKVCTGCHGQSWIDGHFQRLEDSIEETNAKTLTATEILLHAWEQGLAKGPAEQGSPFDEWLEKLWVEQWLFFANSTRFASAMAGADYGSFANGRWFLNRNILEMHNLVERLKAEQGVHHRQGNENTDTTRQQSTDREAGK